MHRLGGGGECTSEGVMAGGVDQRVGSCLRVTSSTTGGGSPAIFFATRVSGISVNSPGLYSRWCGLRPRRHARPFMCDVGRITILPAVREALLRRNTAIKAAT